MNTEDRVVQHAVKRKFNPLSYDDMTAYRHFVVNGRWADVCPFILESPYNNMVSMIEHRIIEVWMDDLIEEVAP